MTDNTLTHPYNSLHIPDDAPFKLAAAPQRGWGAFAKRNIPCGTVILREPALFTIHKPHFLINEGDLWAALRALPPTFQQQFLHLRDNGGAKFRCFTDAFAENCFAVPSSSNPGFTSLGCYILLSRINHSCVPNAKIPDTAAEGDSIACFATRDIAEGEEITFCYNADFMCRTSLDRQRELRFVCECKACNTGTLFHRLSEMRRCLIRGLQYLQHGRGLDGERQSGGMQIIADCDLRRRAEKFEVGVADRLVYYLLIMVLLQQEGLLDKFMVERMQPGISNLVMSLRTIENVVVVREALARNTWEERLGVCLKLWGKRDDGDAALKLRLEMRNTLRMQG